MLKKSNKLQVGQENGGHEQAKKKIPKNEMYDI